MKAKNKKEALKKQMKIEEEERELIKSIKEAERAKASNEIEAFKAKASQLSTQPKRPASEEEAFSVVGTTSDNETDEGSGSESEVGNKAIFDADETTANTGDSSGAKGEVEALLPAPRATQTIQVKFTPRVFPTPQRESTNRQETEVCHLLLLLHFRFFLQANIFSCTCEVA